MQSMATIPAALSRAAAEHGSAPAVVDGDTRLSFAGLAARSEEVARALVAAGVEAGDRVAIWAPNSATWIVASFGVYLAGAVLVPINTRYRQAEARHILATAGARLVFTVSDFPEADCVGMLAGINVASLRSTVVLSGPQADGTQGWEAFLRAGAGVAPAAVAAREAGLRDDSESDIVFTSGTTGSPRGAVLAHGANDDGDRGQARELGGA